MSPLGLHAPTSDTLRPGAFAKYLRDARTLPGDARVAFRVEGWQGVWTEVAERTWRRVYRAARFQVVEQEATPSPSQAGPAGVEVRVLAAAEAGILGSLATRRTLSLFRRRFAAGRVCVVAYRRTQPIGWGWYSERMDESVESYCLPLPADCVYLWSGWVEPRERGRGVGAALVRARLELARDRGARRSWQMIHKDNRSSFRALQRIDGAAIRVVGELETLRVLRWSRRKFRQWVEESMTGGEPRP